MIVALAGCRIDTPKADPKRFPAENAGKVKQQIRDFLKETNATALVSAAACGADILALEAAGELGIRRRVILPFDKKFFRSSFVAERNGDWGERFDRLTAEIEAQGDLIEYFYDKDQEDAFYAANHDILDEAEEVAAAAKQEMAAAVVWNGESRGEDDVTAHFLDEARRRDLNVTEILTT
ncbi:MAG TPA: hypothetical protein PLD20_09090 [Blastocatellia bacterium]|nr:hypothetical protein [Blastocatellia bacterium]HMV85434.1 hypothetical protein [Blastocatellia bacterium]HMX24644.1 hypothetical protein [Blastocatellia bacterium]HMY70581.1 hypothetical protein [Blastocatellia bacterium]HMZ18072.1 hypothetical protein [Blastocatellia bacterium]